MYHALALVAAEGRHPGMFPQDCRQGEVREQRGTILDATSSGQLLGTLLHSKVEGDPPPLGGAPVGGGGLGYLQAQHWVLAHG